MCPIRCDWHLINFKGLIKFIEILDFRQIILWRWVLLQQLCWWKSGVPDLPTNWGQSFFKNSYTKNREAGMLFGFDNSTHKAGRQVTKNWRGSVLAEIKVPWTNCDLNLDRICVILKSTFYPHDFIVCLFCLFRFIGSYYA